MNLSPALKKCYTDEQLSAREAQRLAEFIAWGPVVFQASRLMVKWGILDLLRDADQGLTRQEICTQTALSDYAVKCLLEASLCIGTILVDPETDRFTLSKTGWFLLNDSATRVNIDFNHDVNYEGLFHLEESLKNGKPEGLKHFGPWPTVYEGLSSLPEQVQKSWFSFDHFYSDSSFDEHHVRSLYDVGGNTGKWALQCVGYNPEVEVTILDLPQQIAMMEANVKGKPGAERISGYGINLLDEKAMFPKWEQTTPPSGHPSYSGGELDAIWMSQFLDCFSMDEIVGILRRAKAAMTAETRYFTAIANGNSKMYNTEDLEACIREAGLEIEQIYDHLGHGHSILVVRGKR